MNSVAGVVVFETCKVGSTWTYPAALLYFHYSTVFPSIALILGEYHISQNNSNFSPLDPSMSGILFITLGIAAVHVRVFPQMLAQQKLQVLVKMEKSMFLNLIRDIQSEQ